jgi:hypothetical protein
MMQGICHLFRNPAVDNLEHDLITIAPGSGQI